MEKINPSPTVPAIVTVYRRTLPVLSTVVGSSSVMQTLAHALLQERMEGGIGHVEIVSANGEASRVTWKRFYRVYH